MESVHQDVTPPSATWRGPETRSPAPLSNELWGLDFRAHLPWTLEGGVRFDVASADEAFAFARTHYGAIFATDSSDGRFLREHSTPAKRRFLERSDRFLFWDGETPVGMLVGNPVDWVTYYWRTIAFLPSHQGRRLHGQVVEPLDDLLHAHGVERAEGDVAPTNYRQLRALLRLGYCITGSVNSERWGALLRVTRFLRPDAEDVFTERFCSDRRSARQFRSRNPKKGGHHEEVCNRLFLSRVDPPMSADHPQHQGEHEYVV